MRGIREQFLFVCLLLVALGLPARGRAQEPASEPATKERSWTNSADLSLVVTQGNSNSQTFGFKDTFRKKIGKGSRFQLKAQATKTDKSDDSYLQVDSGFTWQPGELPPAFTFTQIDPPVEPDVGIYFLEGRYDQKFRPKMSWNAGASWDRNFDAGILNRWIAFGGVGQIFWDRDDLTFTIAYGLSYTDREEETPDPLKDDQFIGLRFTWDYMNKWGKVTTFDNDMTSNVSLADFNDWSLNNTSTIAVKMSKVLALSFSLQFLYNAEPALDDADIIANLVVRDPDGIPGSGDEFFETVGPDDPGFSDSVEFESGSEDIRRKALDTIISTSLVINF